MTECVEIGVKCLFNLLVLWSAGIFCGGEHENVCGKIVVSVSVKAFLTLTTKTHIFFRYCQKFLRALQYTEGPRI